MRRLFVSIWRPRVRILATSLFVSAAAVSHPAALQSSQEQHQLPSLTRPKNAEGLIPSTPETGPTLLTPQSTEALMAANNKDVFLMVFADWCAKCSGLKIIYRQVAAALAQVGSSVTVAMVDGTNFNPPGFTDEQKSKFPRFKMFLADHLPDCGEEDARNYYLQPGLGADEIIRFIHDRSGAEFDLEAALAASARLQDQTMAALHEHILEMIARDEESSLQFKLTAMGPCAQPVRDAFLAWRLSQYFPEKDSSHDEHMDIVQRCMTSKYNIGFWEHVSQVASDQIQVADKARKKQEHDKKKR